MNLVKGIDVSYYDMLLDWKLYQDDFAFIKVSEGTVIDRVFRAQWKAARGNTIRGAYHFFRPFVDPKLAAQKVAEYLDGDLGELPLALDLEVTDNISNPLARALSFIEEYRKQTYSTVITYTSKGFWTRPEVAGWKYKDFAEYKLWGAEYPFDKIYPGWTEDQRAARLADIWEGRFMLSFPPPFAPFKRVSFLQFTGKGDPKMIDGHSAVKDAVDMNLYNSNGGLVQDMIREFNIQYIPVDDEEGEEMPILFARVKYPTNIRSSMPGGSYQDIGDLSAGSTIEADDKRLGTDGAMWYHLTKATNPVGGAILTTGGKQVSEVTAWAWGNNLEEYTPDTTPTPSPTLTPFRFKVDGFKEFSGNLEKE